MKDDFADLMAQATALTRSGDLQGATAAIQRALSARASAKAPALVPAWIPADVIPADVIPADVIPADVIPADVIPADVIPAGVVAADAVCADRGGAHEATPYKKPQAQFISGRATTDSCLAYKLFIPSRHGSARRPLVVMLHGCSQNPDDFAAGTTMNAHAEVEGCYVLYPQQSRQRNAQGCWNWFEPSHQSRGRGEAGAIAELTREIISHYPIDAARVYIAGLSAGGAMAALVGAAYPELYAAVGVHSGLAPGSAANVGAALQAMRRGAKSSNGAGSGMPTIVFHGNADRTVHPVNGAQVIAAAVGSLHGETHDDASGAQVVVYRNANGDAVGEYWRVPNAGHAWSGGSLDGSFANASGPDASAQMLRFFLARPTASRAES